MSYYNTIPKRFRSATFENSTFDKQFDAAIEYANSIKSQENNLIIQGGVGTGKTYFAYCLVNKLSKFRETWSNREPCNKFVSDDVLYITIKDLIDDLRRRFSGEESFYKYEEIPVLIIEEVGVQYGTDSERTELFNVFNKRWEEMLPTICLSNLKKHEDDEKKPSLEKVLGQRIIDRLFDGATYIELSGKSKRGI